MRKLIAPFSLLLALVAQPVAAQTIPYGDIAALIEFETPRGERTVAPLPQIRTLPSATRPAYRDYAPFKVLDDTHAALIGITNSRAPAAFRAMLRDFPQIATLEMIHCPGTYDDQANLLLGRMIRAKGLETHVPKGGYVGSGAVELFLAGVRRSAEPSAKFAVHSWEDDRGREPGDLAQDAPQNRKYLDYYRAMGMDDAEARSFYDMTNSVPFKSARWLSAAEMAHWAAYDRPARQHGNHAIPNPAVHAGPGAFAVAGSSLQPEI